MLMRPTHWGVRVCTLYGVMWRLDEGCPHCPILTIRHPGRIVRRGLDLKNRPPLCLLLALVRFTLCTSLSSTPLSGTPLHLFPSLMHSSREWDRRQIVLCTVSQVCAHHDCINSRHLEGEGHRGRLNIWLWLQSPETFTVTRTIYFWIK